jgi:hypothetical protein
LARSTVFVCGGRGQGVDDEPSRVRRVDHVVDLEELSGVERLGVFLCGSGVASDANNV